MTTWLAVSVTVGEAAALRVAGPRRDFIELAERTDATLHFRPHRPRRTGLAERLLGPHIRQAWDLAGRLRDGDVVFADGEHVGIPLLGMARLRGRHPARVVMLGHLPGRSWKRVLLRALTRLGTPGVLLVHSVEQARLVEGDLGPDWRLEAIPYQVDTDFWTPLEGTAPARPLVVAVGSEHRDYDTLVAACDGLEADVVIAAGSHWARSTARAAALPSNVTYLDRPLPFTELRELYRRASAVVVPLHDVPNQSGVTTVLEGMSLGLPVIVTASSGQREVVRGPLVTAEGVGAAPLEGRGPRLLGLELDAPEDDWTGLYVRPGDATGMRRALEAVLGDRGLATRLGEAARRSACASFSIDEFTHRLAGVVAQAWPTSVSR